MTVKVGDELTFTFDQSADWDKAIASAGTGSKIVFDADGDAHVEAGIVEFLDRPRVKIRVSRVEYKSQ